MTKILRAGLGALLLIIPFIPLAAVAGRVPDAKGLFTPYQWILGILITVTLAWLAARIIPRGLFVRVEDSVRRAGDLGWARSLTGALVILSLLLLLVSALAFSFKPLLIDDLVQLFQARIFAAGMLKAPAPLHPEFFITQHMVLDETGWYSQYPPGHSAVMTLGVLAGMPWLVPIVLSVATVFFMYLFVREIYGRETAIWTAFLMLVCPFFFFMGASFMNHVSALFFVTVFLFAFARWEKTSGPGWSLLSGAALGAVALSRPLCALAVGVPFALIALPIVLKERRWMGAVLGLIGVGAVAALFPLYNLAQTGDAFLPGYVKLWGESHGMGFHLSPWGEMHSPWDGFVKQLINLSILNEYLFEWPVPALLPLAWIFMFGLAKTTWDRRLFAAFFFLPLCYFFYWHRDSYLGPRFLYCSLAYLLPLTVRAFHLLYACLPESPALNVRPRSWLVASAIVASVYGLSVGIPQRLTIYATGLQSMKADADGELREKGIKKALVFVPVSWGNRIINLLRARGASASLVESTYRTVDHCLLYQLAKKAWGEEWDKAALSTEMERLSQMRMPLLRFRINDDPTLRLRPGIELSPECAEELAYDKKGYMISAPHILANSPRLDEDFIYATDMREMNSVLEREFPGYPAIVLMR